jgi:hypothetical protein
MFDILIIALHNIFEILELQGTIDIQRNQPDIIHQIRYDIQFALVPVYLCVSDNKTRKDLLQQHKLLEEHPATDATVEHVEVAVEMFHDTSADGCCEGVR